MPSSPDYPDLDPDFPPSITPVLKEEVSKSKPVLHKGHGKSRKKHEAGGEQSKEKASKIVPNDVASSPLNIPPSFLPSIPVSTATRPVNGITSPVLTALGANAFGNTTLDTTVWANNIPYGQSPPNGSGTVAKLADSPPSAPVFPDEEARGGFGRASPPTSPQGVHRLPVRKGNGYQSFGDYSVVSPGRNRPLSMPAQYSVAPPLPHHHQPHFYGVHETDLGLPTSRSTSRQSGSEYYSAFDSLDSAGDEATTGGDTVLLSAFERGLMIYKLEKNKIHVLGRLEGLRGAIVDAKILPCGSRNDPLRRSRPLIAVIVHGPALVLRSDQSSRPGTSHSDDHEVDPSASMVQALHSDEPTFSRSSTHYQTTVEVFSLKEERHVATLFKSPLVRLETHIGNHPSHPPSPVGNLSIRAKGRFVIVASGISGEVYIFESTRALSEGLPNHFRCLGKTWTSIPARKSRSWSTSSASSEVDGSHDGSPTRGALVVEALISLSDRWLATVPPIPSTRSTLHGQVDLPGSSKVPPGLTSHTASSQPPVTCEIDNPLEESIFNKVARDVTQEVLKGARWVGDQGMQAWKNYWNKPQEPASPYDHGMLPPQQQQFPPTHANDDRNRVSQHPTLVSIIDLNKLSNHQDTKPGMALQPVATFTLSGGCSFISFNPSGLSLLTASAKGDVQQIWDLMRVIYGKTGVIPSTDGAVHEKGPSVRQIARFTRMTVANIVDVVWTEPKGEKLGIVTDRGTVHVFDLPASAFQWPPPRRIARAITAAGTETSKAAGTSSPGGAFSTAMNMVSGTTQPLLAAVRGRPPSLGNTISGFDGFKITAGAGVKGGKMVATGFSKSVGAASGTVHTLRHMGDNKLPVPRSSRAITRSCVKWLVSRGQSQLAVVGGGLLRVHDVCRSSIGETGRTRVSVIGGRVVELTLPKVSTELTSVTNMQNTVAERAPPSTMTFQWPQATATVHTRRANMSAAHPLSSAEIETNAPYQPFHTDRRINIFVYDNGHHHLHDYDTWVFGEDLPVKKINVGSGGATEADGLESLLPMENVISLAGDTEAGQQVVVTTRRRRGKNGDAGTGLDEDFFEDDCAVVDFAEERV